MVQAADLGRGRPRRLDEGSVTAHKARPAHISAEEVQAQILVGGHRAAHK
jgi:hypothetical protein